MTIVNPKRIEFARVRRQWTKTRLAKALGVDSRAIQGYESGEYSPEPANLEKIAELLKFPVVFFYGDDLPIIGDHAASFRSMSKMSGALKNSALTAGSIAFLFNEWMEERFSLPTADLPDLSDLPPVIAAETLRRIWGLGEAPVQNIIHLLESKGIRVFSLAIDAKEVDAYSVWNGGKPFVFLNTFKSAEHSRFDAAHELKHLVCDRHSMLHGGEHTQKMEKDAQAFASAFLMPSSNIIASKPRFVSIEKLVELKKTLGVSVAALAFRMNQLGLFTEWTYRSLCIDIAKSGYRTQEPEPMRPEFSQLLVKVLEKSRADGIRLADIARDLNIYSEDLENLTFSLAITGLSSQTNNFAESLDRPSRERPSLRVV